MTKISYTSKFTTPQQPETRNVPSSDDLNTPSVGGSAIAPKKNVPVIDQEQAKRQLVLLGYKPGDNIYLTAFFPKGDARTKGENRDKGRKAERLNYAEVQNWQAEGRGVYFVVNGQSHAKENVKNCRAIFYEHDDLDKDIQLGLWQSLGLPEPTLQVDTGGKSIHSYWVFDEPISTELWVFNEGKSNWRGLQADLLTFAKADRSLVNPNRVMRLAGCWYMVNDDSGTHAVTQSRLVGACGQKYSYDELRGIIPRSKPPIAKQEKRSHPNLSQETEGLLDFRTVGHLLPHWNERGRRKGWATFQCPVHTSSGNHSNDHIHVKLSTGEWKAWCGCDCKLIYQAVCEIAGYKQKTTARGYISGISGGNRENFGGGDGGSGGGDNGGAEGGDRAKQNTSVTDESRNSGGSSDGGSEGQAPLPDPKEGTPDYAPGRQKKAFKPEQTRHWEYLAFDENHEPTQKVRVVRLDDGNGKKEIWEEHWDGTQWLKGLGDIKPEKIAIYRYDEIQEAIARKEPIYFVEDESCADALWELSLPATTYIGGAGKSFGVEGALFLGDLILCPNQDKLSLKHMLNISRFSCDTKWLLASPDSSAWKSLAESGGIDIADWIAECNVSKEEIEQAVIERSEFTDQMGTVLCEITNEQFEEAGRRRESSKSKPSRKEIKSFCQEMYGYLFARSNWIYVFRQIYEWQETHYEPIDNAVITKKIHDYCDKYQAIRKEGGKEYITYPYADPKYTNKAFEWLKQKVGIDPKLVNPPGLNCVDGILQLSYDPDSQKWMRNLIPHDPSFYYLYAPQASYEIPALTLPNSCDRLLSCLDAPERDIFVKTIGASLDLQTVRRYRGREVKALILHGLGNNGKDTLREVTAMMFGYRGMVGATLSDFLQYDQGRKFPLQKLDGANINWPSENADCMMIDKIQILKASITGDPMAGEKKGKDEYQFRPKCTFFFNVNALPKLEGAMEAIKSRFAILKFEKTYKSHPGPGELQADPRFLYDPEFVRTQVLPWYLHYCLDALDRLMSEGINYDITDQAWEDLREETDHIYSFCKEVGLGYKPNAYLSANEVYTCLRGWYIENGILEIEEFSDGRKKDRWSPSPAWGDSLVKGLNQIFPRLLKLFPQARRDRDSTGRHILVGIGWIDPNPCDQNPPENVSCGYTSERVLNVSEDGLKMIKPSNINDSERAEGDLPICCENKNCIDQIPDEKAEEARRLADAWMRCNDPSEVKTLTAQHEDIKPTAWNLLTGEEKNRLRLLMEQDVGKEEEGLKNESFSSNHVQDIQNPSTMRLEVSSGDVQTSSGDVQNCIPKIQNNAAETIDIDQEDAIAAPASCSAAPTELLVESEAAPKPSIAEMRSQLLACQTITDLIAITEGKDQTVAHQAYKEMKLEEQLKIDALIAATRPFPVLKFVGSTQQGLAPGDLVRVVGESTILPNAVVEVTKVLGCDRAAYTVLSEELIQIPVPSPTPTAHNKTAVVGGERCSIQELIARLANVMTPEEFAQATAGHPSEMIQEAITMQNSAPKRQLLKQFLE